MIDPPQVRPEESTAVTPHGGICGGKSQQWLSYPTDPHVRLGGRGKRNQSPLPTPIIPGFFHPGTGQRDAAKWVPAFAGTTETNFTSNNA